MDNGKMGQFIAELRKIKGMTQKELAAQLGITDKAVSKWERGLSSPDIALLSPLSDILGITIVELLDGERGQGVPAEAEDMIDNALQYADETAKSRVKSLQRLCSAVFTALLLTGIAVCFVCDLAMSGGLTWSLFPISSIIFAWPVLFPVIRFGKKGVGLSLLSLSVLVIPFLYVLARLIPSTDLIMPIGIRVSVLSMVYLWCVFALFLKFKERKLLAVALSTLLALPLQFLINNSISQMLSVPRDTVWDIANIVSLLAIAVLLFGLDFYMQKRRV